MTDGAGAGVARLDELAAAEAVRRLLACCGSPEWARAMAAARPFTTVTRLLEAADAAWRALPESEVREALSRHPRIGDRDASGEAAREQSSALGAEADAATARALAIANQDYEARFGRIFIVCATGKTAAEMLALCRERLHNDETTELSVAAEEQRRITRLRLERLAREA